MESAASVTDFDAHIAAIGSRVNPARGTSLDGGHRANWYVDLVPLQAVVDTGPRLEAKLNRPVKCWMELTLGNEKVVRTKENIVLKPRA